MVLALEAADTNADEVETTIQPLQSQISSLLRDLLPNLILPEPLLLATTVVDLLHSKCAGSKTLPAITATREATSPRFVKAN